MTYSKQMVRFPCAPSEKNSSKNMKEDLIEYFREKLDTEIAGDTPLIEGGLIDSMGIQELIAFLESSRNIEFDIDDLTVENFNTIDDIDKLVSMKTGGARA